MPYFHPDHDLAFRIEDALSNRLARLLIWLERRPVSDTADQPPATPEDGGQRR